MTDDLHADLRALTEQVRRLADLLVTIREVSIERVVIRTTAAPEPRSELGTEKAPSREAAPEGDVPFAEAEAAFERALILDALKRTNFVQTQTAELLGITRRVLKYKMDKLGIRESEPDATP